MLILLGVLSYNSRLGSDVFQPYIETNMAEPTNHIGVAPVKEPAAVLTAWPRSAQLTTALLGALALVLLAVHTYGYLPWGARPSTLERGAGIAYRIDLNRADRAELLQLPGVGENLAQRIDNYRREHGGFRDLNELIEVHGIGPTTLERLRPWLQVNSALAEDRSLPVPIKKSSNGARKEPAETKVTSSKEASLSKPIDVNRATLAELQKLPGIGPKRAQHIIDERNKALFRTVDDLMRVPGIGRGTLERLRPYITTDNNVLQALAGSGT
jgi:competence protein ComEA